MRPFVPIFSNYIHYFFLSIFVYFDQSIAHVSVIITFLRTCLIFLPHYSIVDNIMFYIWLFNIYMLAELQLLERYLRFSKNVRSLWFVLKVIIYNKSIILQLSKIKWNLIIIIKYSTTLMVLWISLTEEPFTHY